MEQEKVGRFIAALRRERGMTQEEMGERLGVTNKTVSRWETGKYMPDVDKLLELSGLLGVSVNELLSGERLKDRETLIKKADENLTAALRGSVTFGLADRVAYFRHKWLTEHRFDIGIAVFLYLAAVIALGIWARPLLPLGCVALGVGAYLLLRNRLMAYVEERAFGGESKSEE